MKSNFPILFFAVCSGPAFAAEGLYYTGTEAQESLPIKWSLGANAIYDDNVAAGSSTDSDASMAVMPNLGVSFTSTTPQTTWDVFGKLGLIYYFDAPESLSDDTFSQSRINASFSHRYSERLRFMSRNYVANELEPDYSYGSASGRTGSENFTWMTDNSVGFRWTERLGTYTGFRFSGLRADTDAENDSDRTTIEGYEQFRYQLSPQSVLTPEYRFSQTDGSGNASGSTDQYFIIGVDHRFTPNTIGIFKTGAQLRDVDEGDGGLSPYLEIALQSQVNQQFRLGAYTRYSAEVNSTVIDIDKSIDTKNYDYEDLRVLRVGGNGKYTVSKDLSLLAGADFIFSNYMDGRDVDNPNIYGQDKYETNLNGYVGMSYKLTDYLFGNFYYTYTQTFTDISDEREYDRNRITLGLSAEF
jgi:hypothetical protein